MAFMKKCARLLRSFFGWLLIVLGGMFGISTAICALAALFGGLEVDSLGERLGFFAIYLVMTAAFLGVLRLGIWLKNGCRRKKTAAQIEVKLPPAAQKEPPQPVYERQRPQLNPENAEILPTKRAGQITVRDALNKFLPEEQQRFANQVYQYSQDTDRDGRTPEEAVLFLYERNWAGQAAENGLDRIYLKTFEDKCVITYESLSRNCYAAPPIEEVKTKTRQRSLSTISTWSLEELLMYINREFHLSINICDCCREQQYLAWIEKNNTEFYSMEIMFDGEKQICMVRRENEKSCEEVKFQEQTYFWKNSKSIHGLRNYDYAVEVCLNEKVYYLYYVEIPNRNDTLYWIVNQITESVFESLKHQPSNREEIIFEKKIGEIGGYEDTRRASIYTVLALATGRTIDHYRADDDKSKICLKMTLDDGEKEGKTSMMRS